LGHDSIPPDIFKAAENDDLVELNLALADGQSLSTQDPLRLEMTPLHVAALERSNNFLAAAVQNETCDPWIRDSNLRTAMDHAQAFNNTEGMKILYDPMYAYLAEPDGEVVEFPGGEPPEMA